MDDKIKRLLFVSSSLDTGGAQKMISNITTTLPKEWQVDILLNTDKNIQFSYKGNIISLNISEPRSRTNIFYQIHVFVKRFMMLLKLKKKNSYSACISLLDSANVANIVTGNKYCKTIITAVINMSECVHSPAYKYVVFPMVKLFYNHADCIIAQNSAIKDDLVSNFGLNENLFTIIYNGIDGKEIEKVCRIPLADRENEWFSKNRTFVTAGRMCYAKGQWHLIRAFKKVIDKIPDAKLVIFGFGELKEYLCQLIEKHALESSVCLKGFDSELDKYIANSAVFVLPSMVEGMPTVLLEAMASKTACLVTDFKSGAREIMDYPKDKRIVDITRTEYGVITPVCSGTYHNADVPLEESEDILANAMIELIENSELREYYAVMGKKRSQFFDMENLIYQWIREIEK